MGPSTVMTHSPTSQSRIISLFESFARDLKFTIRSLRRKPGFTFIVALSLALGIGANAAIFSVVDAILLRPLPIPHPDNLIVIDVAASKMQQFGNTSYLDWKDFTSRSRAFESLAIEQDISAGMSTGQGEAQVVYGMLVSGNIFSTLQIQPALGRYFRPDEDQVLDKSPVAVISYSLWGRAFANDPNVIGREVKFSGKTFTIIGVTPKSFTGPNIFFRPDFYLPVNMISGLTTDGKETLTHRGWRSFSMMGRLNPGVTVARAQAEMDGIMRDLDKAYPDTNKDTGAYVRKEMDRRTINNVTFPAIMMGLVFLVLLIACANVAGLLMARATTRMREISTQFAVGATRGVLLRQLLTESAVLAMLGGACGILVGFLSIQGFTAMLPYSTFPGRPQFQLDARVLLFTLLVSTLSVFLCGLAPAFSAGREAMVKVTSNVRAGSADNRAYGAVARRVLIAGQIALSTMLLIGAGLFLKAFAKAQRVELGFNPDHVLLVNIDPSLKGYSPAKSTLFHLQLLQQVKDLPGVQSASLASSVPFLSGASWDIAIDGFTTSSGEKFVDIATNQVAPDYFNTMQIPVLRGREFNDHDKADAPLVAIVNETLARRFIVHDDELEKAIGHKISLRDHEGIPIVGVVKDSNYGAINMPAMPVFYLPFAQMARTNSTFYVRTQGDPGGMTAQIRAQLHNLDPDVAPISVLSYRTIITDVGLFMPRVTAILGGAFGVVALLLAVVGLYGVVSFLVGRRTQEIGVRIALGAQKGSILRMVLSNGIVLAFAGLAAGAVGSFLLAPLLSSLLMGVSPRDPEVFMGIAVILIAATLAASWVPARRATRVDPMVALRYE